MQPPNKSSSVKASIEPPAEIRRRIEALRRLSEILDSAMTIPGTGFRIGLDSLLGFIPGFGDSIGTLASTYFIIEAARLGVPKHTLFRMLGNLALDSTIGSIPLLGDLFDIAWKANARNMALLDEVAESGALKERSSQEVSKLIVAVTLAGLLLVAFAILVLVVLLIDLVF